ncbi:MAG: trypsin-like peptidase domain-containing protein [Bacteroidaceae bacterium]|nr:trypsin-like peptidase domain-containing protein [Bacteroidaceae bacterium]
MKQTTKNWLGCAAIVATSSLLTGAVIQARDTQAAESCVPQMSAVSAPVGGYVDLTTAAESSVNSVVYIQVVMNGKTQRVQVQDPFEDFFGDFFGFGGGNRQREYKTPDRRAAGSGVIISSDGYIVTNNHVVGSADAITVKLNDNREFKGRIIGCDETSDLALIKVDAKDLPAIAIGNSDELKLGQWVLAVGNPFNLTSTVTAGIVSAKARTLGANGVESFIQTDAAINSGNSGGALVNERGELVGINAMLYSQTGSYSGYGFAIPTTIMNKVVADLKAYGVVQRAVFGITGGDVINYIDSEKQKGNEPDLGTNTGIYVDKVSEESAASEAGLQKGDVVVKFDGKNVTKMAELQEALAQHKPGDKVDVSYIRNKKQHTETVMLRNAQGGTKVMEEVDLDQLGVSVHETSVQEKQELGINYGLTINAIRNGKMKEAGATKGTILLQVNDRRMQTVDDWAEAVKAANQSTDRTLWIKAVTPSGRKVSYVIDLNE